MRSLVWFLAGAITLAIVYGGGLLFLTTHANGFSARAQPDAVERWAARRARSMAAPAGAKERANPVPDSAEISRRLGRTGPTIAPLATPTTAAETPGWGSTCIHPLPMCGKRTPRA